MFTSAVDVAPESAHLNKEVMDSLWHLHSCCNIIYWILTRSSLYCKGPPFKASDAYVNEPTQFPFSTTCQSTHGVHMESVLKGAYPLTQTWTQMPLLNRKI